MSIIFILILFLFFISFLRDILFYCWLWQIKEYRADRILSYLKTSQDIKHIGIKILFFCILAFLLILHHSYVTANFVLISYLALFLNILNEVINRSVKRPKPTIKILAIITISLMIISILSLCFLGTDEYFLMVFLMFLSVSLPTIISLSVLSINPIFDLQKKRIINRAALKMRSLKKVRTIGITGSYGKTSTKESLYAILSRKFKVVKTEGNNNTNIGVAYTILNKVSDDLDFFICEMGAYKIGEISEMCGVARPDIGILTGINDQHVELFGGIENTIKAKFELIEALPESGKAVINEKLKDRCEKMKFKVKNIGYFSIGLSDKICVGRDHTEFIYKGMGFRLNLLGKHYIENLISAIMISEYLGMTVDEIRTGVEAIASNEYMMRKSAGANGSVFIDDSYSANPDGVIAALDYLKDAFPEQKKIIVFPGIIELGAKSTKIHEILFKRICETCDVAFILDTKYSTLNAYSGCDFIFEKDFKKTALMLKDRLNDSTVVLFESRGAGAVMKYLNKLK